VTLALTFLALLVVLTALFWLMASVVQPFLYTEVAPALGWRSLAAGVLMAGFLSFWAHLNANASHRDKYGTFFDFTPTAIEEVTQFDAIRRYPGRRDATTPATEETVSYVRANGTGGRVEFVEAKNPTVRYAVSSTNYMTVAILIPQAVGEPLRLEAELDPTGRSYRTPDRIFRQVRGSRTLEGEYPGVIRNPDRMALILAFGINVAHYLLWFVAFAFLLRYDAGSSLGFAAGFGMLTMLAIMPLLFQRNAPISGLPPVPVIGATAG
jgi:hypothetical protein